MSNHQILEWNETILDCQNNIWLILTSTINDGYIHKILTENGKNIYLVAEDFLDEERCKFITKKA